ncbi:NHL repeat-containing protein [Intrasporangium mesophilum]
MAGTQPFARRSTTRHTAVAGIAAVALGLALGGCSSASPTGAASTASHPSSPRTRVTGTSTIDIPPPPGTKASSTAGHTTAGTTKAPARYKTTVVFRGVHPDDLVIDPSGHLLFSDYTDGTISRLDPNGKATILHKGLAGPEGLVFLRNGSLVVAEEKTNRILEFWPGSSRPMVLKQLPGKPTLVECHQGVDGIGWDPSTSTLIVPDAPTGTIYRLTPDGSTLTRVAGGFVHPVGATADSAGAIYVADECGGNVWKVSKSGAKTRVAPAVMPDDVVLDTHGNLLVTDVRHTQHSLRRFPLGGGAGVQLAGAGLVEPQGLVVDAHGDIYVSDDIVGVILKLTPVK